VKNHQLNIIRRTVGDTRLAGLHPTLTRIYQGRDITSTRQLDYSLSRLLPPVSLTGMDAATELLEQALDADAHILFIGDFDADGATACAVGILGLRRMGANNVGYLVPNRFEYGYGLSPEIVGVAASQQPDVLITVDNGIASIDGVSVAQELGMSVIVTDHHLPGSRLPTADVIVNPNLPGDAFPSKALAGVGVIFYVLLALRARLRALDWFRYRGIEEPNLAELLDLVAVGTVADLVPLDYNNRVLVAQGLARINAGCCRPGIKTILETANRAGPDLTARDLGFVVGPRLNAAGRLADMSRGIACLLADDVDQAREIAEELDKLNQERREIESAMQQQANDIVNQLRLNGVLPMAICLYDDDWHQGIVGLVASRVRERTGRPAVVFAPDGNGVLKGSARSIDGLHIRDLLDGIATQHPDLLKKFGGHAMAAGLTLEKKTLDVFRHVFERAVVDVLGSEYTPEALLSDGYLADDDLGIEFADLLRASGPWGQRFPEPVFDDQFEVVQQRTVGSRHLKLRVRRTQGKRILDAIAFGYFDNHTTPPTAASLHLVYRLDVNKYQGTRTPQLIIEHIQAC
jgi:single-stranded-DNA-specific exonuclease